MPVVAAGPKGPGLPAFKASIARIHNDLNLLRQRLVRLRDGHAPSAATLASFGVTTFEGHDALEMATRTRCPARALTSG